MAFGSANKNEVFNSNIEHTTSTLAVFGLEI
jgi:hypothetical protein